MIESPFFVHAVPVGVIFNVIGSASTVNKGKIDNTMNEAIKCKHFCTDFVLF